MSDSYIDNTWLPFWRQPLGIMLLVAYFIVSATMLVPSIKALNPVGETHKNIYSTTVRHDFRVFYTAGKLANEQAYNSLYDTKIFEERYNAEQPGTQHFSYPPTALLLFAPLSKLTYLQAFTLWITLASLALIALLYRMSGSYFILAVTLVSPLFLRGIITGQTGMLTALCFAGGLYSLSSGRPVLAGISFGLLVFKPHLALALPICLIASKDWKTLISGAVTLISCIALSYLVFGPEAWAAFFANFGTGLSSEYSAQEETVISFTFWSLFLNMSGSETVAFTMAATGSLFAIITSFYVWKNTENIAARALCLILLPTFASPYFHTYDMTPLVIVFALVAKDLLYKQNWERPLIVGLSIWVLGLIIFKSVMYVNFIMPIFFLILLMSLAAVIAKENPVKKMP